MRRFFIPPHWIEAKHARLEGEVARQVSRVLRMSPGDEVVLLDNTGREYAVRPTSFSKDMVEGDVLSVVQGRGESLVSITLYQGTLKGEKFQWVLQKGTELGVATFVPIVCRRSIPRGRDTSRHARWPRIVTEAAEQSGRCRLSQILEPMPFQDACRRVEGSGISIIPWEQEGATGLRTVLHRTPPPSMGEGQGVGEPGINVFIVPEGGFDEEEVEQARSCGVVSVSLGRRILRSETAAIAVVAAVLYEAEEMGS